MTSCKDIRQHFAGALYEELDAVERQAFDEHLTSCPACKAEFDKLRQTLSIMDQRVRPEPTEAEWRNFWPALRPQLEQQRRRPVILQWIPQRIPAWSYAVAAAVILAVGIYIGRQFTHVVEVREAPSQIASVPMENDSTTQQALAYLERSRNLLIGLTNIDDQHAESFDFGHHQQISRQLADQGTVLAVALNRPNQQQMRQLVEDLQVILLQLANIEVKQGVPAVELVKKGVDDKSILLKINLEEMRSMASQLPKQDAAKPASKSL